MAAVVGVDSSTQSTKVEVRDLETGAVQAVGRASHPATTPPRSEQDPASWWEALCAALDQARTARGTFDDVVAISVAGQQHGMVACDAAGSPVHPGKLWNDTESAAQAASLVERLGAQAWADATGSVPVAAFTVTKLAWLAQTHPDRFARLARVCLPHDWLTARLCGEHVTDRGDASGTGYWDPAAGAWRTDLLDLAAPRRSGAGWDDALPTVLAPFAAAGTVRADVSERTGLPTSALVGPGTGDNMAAALGLGLAPGDVALSLGTSGTVYAVSDTATHDASGCVAGFADASGHFLPLVCTLNATKVTEAFAGLLGVDWAAFDALALAAPIGSGGLVLVPYLDGERTPNRPTATGLLAGIRSDVSREQLARAAVEGVVCGLLDGLDALGAAGVRTDGRLLLLGGGARSAAYRRVVADTTGRTVHVPDADEHVATGACLQAAVVAARASGAGSGGERPDGGVGAVVSRWGLGGGLVVEPGDDAAGGAALRAAYAAARG